MGGAYATVPRPPTAVGGDGISHKRRPINMTRYIVSLEGFGRVAEIWNAEACGHFAFDAGGVENNRIDTEPDIHATMKLLRKLKENGLITAVNTTERLMAVIKEDDHGALFRGIFSAENPLYGLWIQWTDRKFTEIHIHL